MKNESENFKHSYMDMLLLHLLLERDMYGYQLLKQIQKRSKNIFIIPTGSTYPSLYRLKQKGYVTDKEVLVGERKKLREYHIEPEGKKYYQNIYSDYMRTHNGIQNVFNYQEKGDDL